MLKVFYSALEPIFKGLEKEGFEKNGFFNFKKTFQTKKSIKTKKTVGVVSFFSTMILMKTRSNRTLFFACFKLLTRCTTSISYNEPSTVRKLSSSAFQRC